MGRSGIAFLLFMFVQINGQEPYGTINLHVYNNAILVCAVYPGDKSEAMPQVEKRKAIGLSSSY